MLEVILAILGQILGIFFRNEAEKQKALARFQGFINERKFWSKKPEETREFYLAQMKAFENPPEKPKDDLH